MTVKIGPSYRAVGVGVVVAGIIIGAFAFGVASGHGTSTGQPGVGDPGGTTTAQLTANSAAAASRSGRITVTGTGVVTGVPNQVVLSMRVHVSGGSVTATLTAADDAARRVIAALRAHHVAAADIQTSDLSIQPNYTNNGQTLVGYGVSESLSATLDSLGTAGRQIQAAVQAGGNATRIDGISLKLTDTSGLLARAREAAMADARVKATQYARGAGQRLGPVLSITEQTSQPFPVYKGFANAPTASVPISPGTRQLTVSVTVVYAI